MVRSRTLVLGALLLLPSCVFVPLTAWRTASANQRHVARVRIGQTLAEVERVMGKPPERRSTRLRYDGLSIEEWTYVTDYVRKSDTMITFVGGKVEEIRAVPWSEKD